MMVSELIEMLEGCDPNKQVQLSLTVEWNCEVCSTHIHLVGRETSDMVKEEINRVIIYGS